MFLFLFTDIVKLDNNFTMDSLSLIFFFGKVLYLWKTGLQRKSYYKPHFGLYSPANLELKVAI